jgi:phosphoribosylaminoimidazole-succinocarboxamide synthase
VLKGKVSDSVFGEALTTTDGRGLRLMFRNNRISTHDVNRGAIPFKDQVLAINHDHMRRLSRRRGGLFSIRGGGTALRPLL